MSELTAFVGILLLGLTVGFALWIVASEGAYRNGYYDGYKAGQSDGPDKEWINDVKRDWGKGIL